MAPELEPNTDITELNGKKYVMFHNAITIADPDDSESTTHGELVMRGAKTRGIPLTAIQRDHHSKPFVETPGKIFIEEGVVTGFSVASVTTSIVGSTEQALQTVNNLAREILGSKKFPI